VATDRRGRALFSFLATRSEGGSSSFQEIQPVAASRSLSGCYYRRSVQRHSLCQTDKPFNYDVLRFRQ